MIFIKYYVVFFFLFILHFNVYDYYCIIIWLLIATNFTTPTHQNIDVIFHSNL
jgi:hypothetical protein